MSPGSSTESYPAFARIGLRENPGKNLNQVTCPNRDSNPGHLVLRPDALTVTPQSNNNNNNNDNNNDNNNNNNNNNKYGLRNLTSGVVPVKNKLDLPKEFRKEDNVRGQVSTEEENVGNVVLSTQVVRNRLLERDLNVRRQLRCPAIRRGNREARVLRC
ncbi:hypothetical protein ANN_23678 [Periplaneta americana]|uniref:Uncharacterized protein n=1 Tax=Periplaneta americana TaxID=6978 RepID=A0ABQ8SLS6_PERAM|nr:hypothetical protein ANN_23678 [Periplaneta americana]